MQGSAAAARRGQAPQFDRRVAALTHPLLTPAELVALMERAGGKAPIELIDGEVVIIPPPGATGERPGPESRLYMDGGVRELWLIDPAERTALIATPPRERLLGVGDRLTSPLLPGLAIAVSELFA
jgi:Uma2 family endonuclease